MVRLLALVAAASVVAGCGGAGETAGASDGSSTSSATNGSTGATPALTTPALQLRLVISSSSGACSAAPLTSDGPGGACDQAGATTYELAESLGVVTPTSVARGDQGGGQTVLLELDPAGARTLDAATGRANGKQLAFLLQGTVLSAPTVMGPLTVGNALTLGFATAAEADQVSAELGGPART